MRALQNAALLEEKIRLRIVQMKFAKNASMVTQPCDTGDLHKRERNHAKRISMADNPTNSLINPLAEQLQGLRDTSSIPRSAFQRSFSSHVTQKSISKHIIYRAFSIEVNRDQMLM